MGKIWNELEKINLKPKIYKYSDLSIEQRAWLKNRQRITLGKNDTIEIKFNNLEYLEWRYETNNTLQK